MKYIIKPICKSNLTEDVSSLSAAQHCFGKSKDIVNKYGSTINNLEEPLKSIIKDVLPKGKGLIIHHANSNNRDNKPENLYLMNIEHHNKIHSRAFMYMYYKVQDEIDEKHINITESELRNIMFNRGDFIKYILNNPFFNDDILNKFPNLKDEIFNSTFSKYIDVLDIIDRIEDTEYVNCLLEALNKYTITDISDYDFYVKNKLRKNLIYSVKGIVDAFNNKDDLKSK